MLDASYTSRLSLISDIVAETFETAIETDRSIFYDIFGTSIQLEDELDAWLSSGVPLDNLTILPDNALPDADAAYDAASDTIFLRQSLVDTGSDSRLMDALIEELGHRLDARLGRDSIGDEGAALVARLRGEPAPNITDAPATVILPDGTTATVETRTEVTDSGGFEGSSKTLQLETTEGSTISYAYTHFSIPDRFILRYENRNIFDTGFVSGSRSGTVDLPAGTANTVEVIIATDNAGTAWNYTVSAEPDECEAPDPWEITAQGDPFSKNEMTDKCETTGSITLGRRDGLNPLILAANTTKSSFDDDLLEIKGGQIFSQIGNISDRLFTADVNVNLNTGISTLANVTPGDFKLSGLDVEFKSMSVLSEVLAFDVRFVMPDAASGLIVETADFYSQALRITNNGAMPVMGFRIDPPGSQEFKIAGFIDVKASKMAIEYRAGEDALRVQAKVEFTNTNFAKTGTGIQKVEADLSGPNYIQVNSDGQVDVIGVLKAAGKVPLFGGWSINGLEFNINTTTREVGGAGTLGTPFGLKFGEGAEARAEVQFVYDPFELDKVGLTIDNLNKPIPAYPAFFFQRIGGSVDNFAPSNNKPVEAAFTIGATLGPQIGGTRLARAQFDAKVTSSFLEGKLTTDILTAKFVLDIGILDLDLGTFTLAKDESTAKLDWSKGELSFTGTTNFLDGFVVSSGSFKANSNFDFSMSRSTQISLPNFVPVYGGTKIAGGNLAVSFKNDGDFSNDYVAAWGVANIATPFDQYSLTLGLRINFDGSVERIGSGNIPTTSSWFVESGRDFVILSAMWETASNDAQVRVITPDGTVIEEADFAANRIHVVDEYSSTTTRSVIIDAPQEGTWDLEVVDPTGLGEITYEASGAVDQTDFDFTTLPMVNADGSVTYAFTATTTGNLTSATFYYDDDLTELDGLQAGTAPVSDGDGSFTWDTTSVVPGTYFLYALVDDGTGPITVAQTTEAVTVGSEADLAVTIAASTPDPAAGQRIDYTVTVENTSTDTAAKGAKVLFNLPEGATLLDSTIPSAASDMADLQFDLGELAAAGTTSFTVGVQAPDPLPVGTQLIADALVLADTYDANPLNDNDTSQEIVPPSDAESGLTDLSVDSKIDALTEIGLNETFTYIVTVANTGTADATNVVLTETVTGLNALTSAPTGSFFNDVLTTPLGTVAAGESIDVEITATSASAGRATTISALTAEGLDRAVTDNEEINVTNVQSAATDDADLSVLIRDVTVGLGSNFSRINVEITNDGPGVASDIEVRIGLPAGAAVQSSDSVQGTFDETTGIWSVGNLRDNLSRTLDLALTGLIGQPITAEVVAVTEPDPDSQPNDGMGDDFASITGVASGQSGDIDGTDTRDVLFAIGTNDIIDAKGGDDLIRPGLGVDTIKTGPGSDAIGGLGNELTGDTIEDFSTEDVLIFEGARFSKNEVRLEGSSPQKLQIDANGDGFFETDISLDKALSGGGFLTAQRLADTHVIYQQTVPYKGEGETLSDSEINGMENRSFLTGDGTAQFQVTLDGDAVAGFDNALGVYEVTERGEIVDVRMLATDVKSTGAPITVNGVDEGNVLGFFIIRDGKDYAAGLSASDTLAFTDSAGNAANAHAGEAQTLTRGGVQQSVDVFHSYAGSLNGDGISHVVSGLSRSGDALTIGFEDQMNGGDKDFQDVLLNIDIL